MSVDQRSCRDCARDLPAPFITAAHCSHWCLTGLDRAAHAQGVRYDAGLPPPQRLKAQKLLQWALAYLAGAWVLYEVAATVGGNWGLPNVLFQALSVLFAIGFSITLKVNHASSR